MAGFWALRAPRRACSAQHVVRRERGRESARCVFLNICGRPAVPLHERHSRRAGPRAVSASGPGWMACNLSPTSWS